MIAECASVRETLRAVQAFRPDLLLLAMQMPEGGAMEVIEQIGPDRMPNVVFLTRDDDDMTRGLDAHALDYLVSPFPDAAMHNVIEGYRARHGARNYVRLHVGDKSHLLRGPLTAIHAQLDPAMFARIHRSIIVNVDRIAEVQPWVGGDYVAILHSGERLRVSRNFRGAVVRSPVRVSA